MRSLILTLCFLTMAPWAAAQESTSFRLNEHVLNSGGGERTSASFRIGQDALGGAIGHRPLSGPSFRMDPGFTAAYRPAGEVTGLVFTDAQTLSWDGERAAAGYSLYRDLVTNLSGLGYGNCLTTDIPSTTTTDPDVPPLSDGWFYLVASRNRLDDEGTTGFDSDGAERHNPTPCP